MCLAHSLLDHHIQFIKNYHIFQHTHKRNFYDSIQGVRTVTTYSMFKNSTLYGFLNKIKEIVEEEEKLTRKNNTKIILSKSRVIV